METKTLRNIYRFLVGSFYFLWRTHVLAGIVLKQLEATNSDKGCGWGVKMETGSFFFLSLKVSFCIIFWHFPITTVSKIRWSHLSDFQYMVRYLLAKLWNRQDKWTGLWDFGYLGVAYVSSLEILYVLRKLLSLMEIWEGCMHFKREVGGSSLKAWTTKPGLSSWNKQTKTKNTRPSSTLPIWFTNIYVFFPLTKSSW